MAFPNDWSGYEEIYLTSPITNITGYTYFLPTSALSTTWKNSIQSNGADIRISLPNNERLPTDVISTGLIGFSFTGIKYTSRIDRIRIWAGNSSASLDAADSQYGQYNVYNDNVIAFYPTGFGQDRTRNQYHLTGSGNITAVNGPFGIAAQYQSGVGYVNSNNPTGTPIIISALAYANRTGFRETLCSVTDYDFPYRYAGLFRSQTNPAKGSATNITGQANFTFFEALSPNTFETGQWTYLQAYFDRINSNRFVYLNGQTDTDGSNLTVTGLDTISLGANYSSAGPTGFFDGSLSLVQVSKEEYTTPVFLYNHSQTSGFNGFYTSSGWYENFGKTTGNYLGYQEATFPSLSDTGAFDFVYFFPTVLLGETWHSLCNDSGANIVVTREDNTRLAADIHRMTGTTGIIAIGWPGLTSPTGGRMRFWLGNEFTNLPDKTGLFGRYESYLTELVLMYPSGAGENRTKWEHYLQSTGTAYPALKPGPIPGSWAAEYGTGINSFINNFTHSSINWPLETIDTQNVGWAGNSLFRPFSQATHGTVFYLGRSGVGDASFTASLRAQDNFGVTSLEFYNDISDAPYSLNTTSGYVTGSWVIGDIAQLGFFRDVYINGSDRTTGLYLLNQSYLDDISIGGLYTTDTDYSTTFVPFSGYISLTKIYRRYRNQPEIEYDHFMIDDPSGFWQIGDFTLINQGGSNIGIESISNSRTYAYSNIGINYYSSVFVNSITRDIGLINRNRNIISISNNKTLEMGLINRLSNISSICSNKTLNQGTITISGDIDIEVISKSKTIAVSTADIRRIVEGEIKARTIALNSQNLNLNNSLRGETKTRTSSDVAVTVTMPGGGDEEDLIVLSNTKTNISAHLVLETENGGFSNTMTALENLQNGFEVDSLLEVVSKTRTRTNGTIDVYGIDGSGLSVCIVVYITMKHGLSTYINNSTAHVLYTTEDNISEVIS